MNNTVTTAEIKRRGMAAIGERLGQGPLHILKRNKPAAVVLSEEECQRLLRGKTASPDGLSAVQWLLGQPGKGALAKAAIDAELTAEGGVLSEMGPEHLFFTGDAAFTRVAGLNVKLPA